MPQDDTGKALKDLTLEELEATRNDMLLLENKDAAKSAGGDTYENYFDTLIRIQAAIRDLQNAELLRLLRQLRTNESALRESINDLAQARKNIGHVKTFLKVADKLLQVVGKVVSTVV
jgi:ribosomal protein L29